MPPQFQKADRIELKNPPLELVICQLRFPPILKLAAGEAPEEFQTALSQSYPLSKIHQQFVHVQVPQRAEPDEIPDARYITGTVLRVDRVPHLGRYRASFSLVRCV